MHQCPKMPFLAVSLSLCQMCRKYVVISQNFLAEFRRGECWVSLCWQLPLPWQVIFTYLQLPAENSKALISSSKKSVTVKKLLGGINTAIGKVELVCYCTIWGISLQALAFFLARDSQGGSTGLHGVIGRLEDCLVSFSAVGAPDAS